MDGEEGRLPSDEDQHQRPSRVLWVLASLTSALGLVIFVLTVRSPSASGPGHARVADRVGQAVAVDRPAPDFSLRLVRGSGSVSLSGFKGRVVVLNFWASWCGPCREEGPLLQALWTEYRGRGVQFLGIDHLDARTQARSFQEEFGVTYPSGFDPGGTVASRYGLLGVPSTFIVNSESRIRYAFLGKVDEGSFRRALEDVLKGAGP